MSKVRVGLLSFALVAGTSAALTPAIAVAAQPESQTPALSGTTNPPVASATNATIASDDLIDSVEAKRRALRDVAVQQLINGEAVAEQRGNSKVVQVGTSATVDGKVGQAQYAEVAREGTDKIFVVLAEFGDKRATNIDPHYADQDTNPDIPGPTDFDGPRHNQIPEPDRSADNSTVWQPDYDRAHYENMYFGTGDGVESLKTYYEAQSSGQYSVDGLVTDWVKVKYNEARYGRSNGFPCDSNVCSNSYELVKDGLDAWVQEQYDAGMTDEDIAAELAEFDVWDRYDFDGDGDFNEPDGYIDHFQIVHAGGDQSDGDPYQGEDALWAHRSKAFAGTGEGPPQSPKGGTQIGETGLWVLDYTMQPENGGVSVFAHEYGHDLGLPDLYDRTNAGEGAAWWTIMSQSRLSGPDDVGLGTRAGDMGPWEKMQLGWLDYTVASREDRQKVNLGPHEMQTEKAQAVIVPLEVQETTNDLGDPFAGEMQWWSGAGDDYEATMQTSVDLSGGSEAELSLQARWNIEDCGPDACDYAFVEVDDGSGWTAIAGSITNPDEGNAIDGYQEDWTAATFDLSAYAGETVDVRVRYTTDGAAQGQDPTQISGIFVDDTVVTVDGDVLVEDGAENGDGIWTLDGFEAVTDTQTVEYPHYYIASNREYISYDQYLKSGPYNFGFADTRPDWVEHFPYQDGLLIWYWNTKFNDNDLGTHPGEGLVLPIDSNPHPIYALDGDPWRIRIGLYDAPFGLQKSDSFSLHRNSQESYIRGESANPVFNDRKSYYDPITPYAGVKLPDNDVRIRVLEENGDSVKIRVRPSNR